MKPLRTSVLLLLIFFTFSIQGQDGNRQFYQLKTYTFASEQQEQTTDAYLRDAYLPALKRSGISKVGAFKVRPGYNVSTNKTYVLIPFTSLNQFEDMADILSKDTDYLTKGKDYLEADHKNVPYGRIESVLMRAFTDMPTMKTPQLEGDRKDRVYELRSYESPNETYYINKVEMFNEGGEVILFEELGFNAVFYADVLSGSKMPNLMYMTTFENIESREAHWKAFVDSPKWKELSSMPKYQNNVSHADIMLLYPTKYSDY